MVISRSYLACNYSQTEVTILGIQYSGFLPAALQVGPSPAQSGLVSPSPSCISLSARGSECPSAPALIAGWNLRKVVTCEES